MTFPDDSVDLVWQSYVANNPDAQVTIVTEMTPVKQKPGQPLIR